MKAWIWITAGILGTAAAAAPWGVGVVTETQWQQATTELNAAQPFMELDTRRYERTYLGARIEGMARLRDPDTGEVQYFPYTGDVSHGVTGSQIELRPTEDGADRLASLFPERQPSLTMSFRAWGSVRLDLNIPALSLSDEATGESLQVAEIYGWMTGDYLGGDLELELRAPGAVLRTPQARYAANNLQLSQSLAHLSGDVWTGEGSLTLDSLNADTRTQGSVALEGLRIRSDIQAEDDGQRFSSVLSMVLEEVDQNGVESGPHEAEFVMQGLDVAAWNRATGAFDELRGLMQAEAAGAAQRELIDRQVAVMESVNESARALAAGGFAVGLQKLRLQLPEGDVVGSLMLEHPRLPAAERDQLSLVMQRLTGTMKLSLPSALLQSQPLLLAELRPLLDQGLLVRDGDALRLSARLEDMEVDVNGNRIPLPPIL